MKKKKNGEKIHSKLTKGKFQHQRNSQKHKSLNKIISFKVWYFLYINYIVSSLYTLLLWEDRDFAKA